MVAAIAFMESTVKRGSAAVVWNLLFGLPSQDGNLGRDLAIARDIGLDWRRSLSLNVLPNTPLGKAVENGRTTNRPLRQNVAIFICKGCDFMDDDGWRCISNSHWGRTTRERNLYNLLIKQGADLLAFGSEPAVRLMVTPG